MSEALEALKLTAEVRARVERALVQRLNDAVAGAATRDSLLAELDDQLEGRLQPVGKQRWKGASILNDPLSREAHLELLALMTQAQRKDPKWQVEAVRPEDAEKASQMEAWLTNKAAEYQLNEHLYHVAYNMLRDPAAVLYVGWRQSIRTRRTRKYREEGTGKREEREEGPISSLPSLPSSFTEAPLLDADEREEGGLNEEILVEQAEIVAQGCEFRTPDLADFYVYPADAQNLKTAIGCGERMLLTEDQLLDGVEDYGYDARAVARMIALGPTHAMDSNGQLREQRALYDGTDGATLQNSADGFYECFLWFGRLPKLRDADGELGIPDTLFGADVMAMLCPAHDLVFQLDKSPFPDRPYILFSMLYRPNRLQGIGACQLLGTLQEEASANLQMTLDGMNLEMAPVLVAPPEWISKYNAWSIYPGAILPEEEKGTLRPLEWGQKAERGLELQAALVARGKGLVAAQGYGELQAKVRKAAEVQNVLAATDSKFDLFLFCAQLPMAELAARIVALHLHFLGADLSETFTHQGQTVLVTAQALRGQYRYIPTATSTTSTPEMRLRLAQAKQGVQTQYFTALAQLPPAVQPRVWHGARQVLLDMGERQPEAWIGPEPAPPSQAPPELMALLQAGVPPQVIQQLLAAGQQGVSIAQGAQGALS